MKMETSDYLFHYTSIESLALILKFHTIRLNPLCNMDDRQEQQTADMKGLGRYIFVSSWTDDIRENIPMWNMYTGLENGVRIGLKKNPFKYNETKGSDFVEQLNVDPKQVQGLENQAKTFLNIATMMKMNVFSPQCWNGDILKKVEYSDDPAKLVPQIIESTEGGTKFNFANLGSVKNTFWNFQNEWRYIMQFYPFDFSIDIEIASQKLANTLLRIKDGTDTPPLSYYDLYIDDAAFNSMIITPSPRMTAGNRVLLDTLLEKYNSKASIIESELIGLI